MKSFICLFFCVLVLTGCSDPRSKIRGKVLAGCIQGSANKALCTCGFDKVESEYGDQLETMTPSQFFPFFHKALLECRDGKSSVESSRASAEAAFRATFAQALTSPTPATPNNNATAMQTASGLSARQALDRAITEQVNLRTKYGGGNEYREARKILEADLNGDGTSDAIVLYTIEGAGAGNAVVHTLGLFWGSQGNYYAQDSTIVSGASDIAQDSDSTIVVTSLSHGPDDPNCCPSITSYSRYRVEGNQLLPLP